MFKAHLIYEDIDITVFQILRSSHYRSGHEAVCYDYESDKWCITDLNNIKPTKEVV